MPRILVSIGLDTLPKKIGAAVIAAIIAAAGTALADYLGYIGVTSAAQRLIRENRLTKEVGYWIWRVQVSPMSPGYINVVVADLEDDEAGHSNTEHVVFSLERQFTTVGTGSPIRVQRSQAILRLPPASDTTEGLLLAAEMGRRQLAALNADLMVWGEVARGSNGATILRLRFLRRSEDQARPAESYLLDQMLELPESFGARLGTALAAQVAADVAPAHESGRYVVRLLQPRLDTLRQLAANMPPTLSAETRASVTRSYAIAAQTLGQQKGENGLLLEAIHAYRSALQKVPRASDPDRWAATQNELGTSLWMLGERKRERTYLEEAITAYRAALEERTKQKAPLQWAETQNNIGVALWSLGQLKETDPALLREAIETYRKVLEEWTREKVPLKWATTQNNLGAAFFVLGFEDKSQTGTEHLEESLVAYRKALLEWTREKVPLNWANTQRNIAITLTELGSREGANTRIAEAMSTCQLALQELAPEKVPLDWALTQSCLGDALTVLGQRETGNEKLEEAIDAYRAALTQLTPEKTPGDWREAISHLGTALTQLAKRMQDRERARAVWREALGTREEIAKVAESDERANDGVPGSDTAAKLGNVAWYALFAQLPDKALTASERAIGLAPELLWLESNRAHALLYLGRVEEAQQLYLAHKGKQITRERNELWEQAIAEDFDNLRKANLERPEMADIEAALATNQAQGHH